MVIQKDYDYTFKIAITGNSSVGKSSLIMRFTDDFFSESLIPTIGVDFKIRSFDVDNKIVKLNIWDTAGQERFNSIIQAYYKGIHACLIVFDITDRQSFLDVQKWFDKYKQNTKSEVQSVLIGNKSDLTDQRAVEYTEAAEFARELGVQYFETSAKTKQNVDECFIQLSKQLVDNIAPRWQNQENREKVHCKPQVNIQNKIKKDSKMFCC